MPHPISIQSYTIRDLLKTDFQGTIRQLAEIGYPAIEGGPGPMKLEEYKRFLDDLGMHVSSNWAMPRSDNLNAIVDAAKTLGYTHIVNGFGPEQFATANEARRSADRLVEAAELLAPHGLTFCVHNHAWEFNTVDGHLAYHVMMERAPDLHAELDIYWASNFGAVDVPQQVSTFRNRIPLLHVKDGPLVKDAPNTAVGGGRLDVAACIRAADADVLQYLIVEMDHCATDTMTAVRESYQWLVQSGLGTGNK